MVEAVYMIYRDFDRLPVQERLRAYADVFLVADTRDGTRRLCAALQEAADDLDLALGRKAMPDFNGDPS